MSIQIKFAFVLFILSFALTESFTGNDIKRYLSASKKILFSSPNTPINTLTRTYSSISSTLKMSSSSNFLSVSECIQRHSLENTIFVDGSWHLSSRDGREEYENGPRIQNSRFFDIDDVATKNHPHNVPHMMPPKKLFALAMDNLEISPSSDIIIYGTAGSFSTPRTYYTLRAMGHDTSRLHMMEGSLKEWIDAGGPIETGKKESVKMEDMDLSINTDDIKYDAAVDAKNVVDYEEVTDIVNKGEDSDSIIVDARSAGRFVGEAPEPRPGLKGGHMPGAKNVPFNILMEEGKMNKFLSKEEMVKIFKEAGVDVETDKKIVCTCGSGVTACVLTAALEECGRDPATTMIYDGSWIEWASTEDAPVIKRE